MFRIFVAVFLAIGFAKCAFGEEPSAYDKFKAQCEAVNAGKNAPPAWCECLTARVRVAVPEADLATAMDDPEPSQRVLRQIYDAAETCRAQLKGEVRL